MDISNDNKTAIIAAVLQSPLIVEVVKAHPPSKWDEPAEIASITAQIANAIIETCKLKIK